MKKLYYNGNIITMVKEGECVDALLTEGARTKETGNYDDILKRNEDVQVVDLHGGTLMPAFIDGHSHFLMAMQIGMMADLSDCNSFDDIVSTMRDFIKKETLRRKALRLDGDMIITFSRENDIRTKTFLTRFRNRYQCA